MGSCTSQATCTCSYFSEDARRNRQMASAMDQARRQDQQIQKLLLLGAGGSGKSTFFKQLKMIHGTGIKATEIQNTYLHVVYNNVLQGMQTLVEKSLEIQDTNPNLGTSLRPENIDYANFIVEFDEDLFVHERGKVAIAIKSLWADPGIQNCWKVKSKFHIQDSAKHFFEHIERITEDDYVPDQKDILMARIRTTGIVQQEFWVKSLRFQVFDVGGQRNERKKWIHCFEDVTAVLFLAALSAYDMTLYEDQTTNRMKEALDIFQEICTNKWFRNTAMILFLNKKDIFAKKILQVPISVCFPEYDGPPKNEIEAKEYIKAQFVKINQESNRSNHNDKNRKTLFVHYTCAIDQDHVKKIFRDVQALIIHNNLAKADII